MNEKVEQAGVGSYGITVFHDNGITFFSIMESSEPNRTRMLMWKQDVGFEASIVVRDPNSDLEFTRPLDASEFPASELLRLLRDHPEILPSKIAAELAGILQQGPPR